MARKRPRAEEKKIDRMAARVRETAETLEAATATLNGVAALLPGFIHRCDELVESLHKLKRAPPAKRGGSR